MGDVISRPQEARRCGMTQPGPLRLAQLCFVPKNLDPIRATVHVMFVPTHKNLNGSGCYVLG